MPPGKVGGGGGKATRLRIATGTSTKGAGMEGADSRGMCVRAREASTSDGELLCSSEKNFPTCAVEV
jgi:hypothetical protein